ncbi:hypothetical protein ACWEOW_14650 [Monashia sp. NPDC004114]
MIAALWHRLPGPTWLRGLVVVALVVALVAVCFEWVFPLVARSIPLNEQTVGAAEPMG